MSTATRKQIEKQLKFLGENTAKSVKNSGDLALVTGQTITAHALIAILEELEKQNNLLAKIEKHLSNPNKPPGSSD